MQNIVFSDIFIDEMKKTYNKHKKKNGSIVKHSHYKRFASLLNFVRNSCYWSRHNIDADTGKRINPDDPDGKFLNEIHLFLCKHGCYNNTYPKVLMEYLRVTEFKTLLNISVDSMFVSNVLGKCCSRNPIYNNKPGLKIHALVDSNGVPLSIIITDCNVHDSVPIDELFDNMFIDVDIFLANCHYFLADSAYSALSIMHVLTSYGLEVIVGRNGQHVRNFDNIQEIEPDVLKKYKSRGIVENFNSHLQRIPCLRSNYEKTIMSYKGLVMFYLSNYVCNKLNTIIDFNNSDDKKRQKIESRKLKKKEDQKKRKQTRYELNEAKKIKEEEEKRVKQAEKDERNNKISISIWNNLNKDRIRSNFKNLQAVYKRKERQAKKIKKVGRPANKFNYSNYIKQMKPIISKYVQNNILTKTGSYIFSNKTLYATNAPAFAFIDKAIKDKMKNLDISQAIENISKELFG